MRLLAMVADRVLSTVVPHVTASACLKCPTITKYCECSSYKDHLVKWYQTCSYSGCDCTVLRCGACYHTSTLCS
jgi:hypothetical protein